MPFTPDPQGSRKESRRHNSSNPSFLVTHRSVSFHLLFHSLANLICIPFPGPQHLSPRPSTPAPQPFSSEVHAQLHALRVHCLWIPKQPAVQFNRPEIPFRGEVSRSSVYRF